MLDAIAANSLKVTDGFVCNAKLLFLISWQSNMESTLFIDNQVSVFVDCNAEYHQR
jgi:hypothetical protein